MPALSEGTLWVVSPVDFAEACFSVPAVRALKRFRPSELLVVLCPESLRAFWETVPELDELVVYQDKMSSRKIARVVSEKMSENVSEKPLEGASAILWEAGEAAKAMAKMKIPQRLGYPAPKLDKLLTDPVSLVVTPGPIEHRVRYYLNLIQELGAEAFVAENFKTIPFSQVVDGSKDSETVRIAWISESEYGEAYQWSESLFEQVKTQVENGIQKKIEWVKCENRSVATDQQIVELLSSCSALLACDGEVAHWAAHFGMPAVVVFGPNEPAWKRPLGKQSRVIREHVACSPCYLTKCPLDGRCQSEICPDAVADALLSAF